MKKLNKICILGLLAFGVLFYTCETTDLDLRTNPNALNPSQADVESLLNNIQLEFVFTTENFAQDGSELTRIDYMFGRNYRNNYTPEGFNNEWTNVYADMLADSRIMQPLAEEAGLTTHLGIAKTLESFMMVTLVDFFGDVPYSEALQGSGNFNPLPDSGEEVYAQIYDLLDEAEAHFNTEPAADPANDFFYGGDRSAWLKVVNTIRLKMYIQTRLVDPGAVAAFNSIISSGNYISSTSDDWQFRWGTNTVQPDTRHPLYSASYTTTGAGVYQSNWLMNYMMETDDPRIRYYFYRQNEFTPGAEVPPNEETLQCSLQNAPDHYVAQGFADIFCFLPNGYWGRVHGNNEGIPPDGFLRTIAGVYPAGGAFDDDAFEGLGQGEGAGGNGITPILLASTVDFWEAEVAMLSGGDAKQHILDGTEKSINKVQTFVSLDADADTSFEPSEDDNEDYLASIESEFDSASTVGKWNLLGELFFVSLFGNGIDAYNFYRRTGYPTTLPPNIEVNAGPFIRSMFYPANHTNTNANVQQKDGVTEQVFWDTNPASPGFPASN